MNGYAPAHGEGLLAGVGPASPPRWGSSSVPLNLLINTEQFKCYLIRHKKKHDITPKNDQPLRLRGLKNAQEHSPLPQS
jgi:hypothetical protein